VIATTTPPAEHFVYAGEVVQLTAIIVVAMIGIVIAYKAMQRPRLVVTEVEPGVWRARRRDAWQYAISIPFLLLAWTAALDVVLLLTNNGLSGQEVSAVAVAIVVSVRVLAHVSHEHAHELAKAIPLTIVTLLIVTSNGWRTQDDWDRTVRDWATTDLTDGTTALLVGTELVIVALWYWVGVRWWWPRGHDVVGLPRWSATASIEEGTTAERITVRRRARRT
jgi:hypothetical protein